MLLMKFISSCNSWVVCSHHLLVAMSKQELFPVSIYLSMMHIGFFDDLRELFCCSGSDEQQKLMAILPPEWGRDRMANWFNASHHQARDALERRSSADVFANSQDQRGNKTLDSQSELIVYNYYMSDNISRETSYKKQVIHPPPYRIPVPLRFLHLTINETFEQFKMNYPDLQIGRSKFFSLRLKWVRERTPHETCLCIYHENASLLLEISISLIVILNSTFQFKSASTSLSHSVSIKELLEKPICENPSEYCHYRHCDKCHDLKASDILCQGIDVDLEDLVSWLMWKKTASRYELLHSKGPFRLVLNEIDELWPQFITHSFITHQHRDYINLSKKESSLTTFAVVQLDFAQNFSFVIQREVQSAYFARHSR